MADEAVLATKRAERFGTDEEGKIVDLEKKATDWARKYGISQEVSAEVLDNYGKQLERYLRKGDRTFGPEEMKALSVGSDPDGGYAVTPDTSGRMAKKIFDTSPMRAYASTQVIGTNSLDGTYDDDEAGGGWVSETGSRTETDTPELGVWNIPVHELYAKPKATQKLLDDANIDIEEWLAGKVGAKLGRIEATAFVNGSGVNQPRGFLTYADGTSIREQIEQIDTGVNGDFAVAPAGLDVFITATTKLRSEYRAGAHWFMNSTTQGGVRLEKDSDGRWLWQPSVQVGQPSMLLGYPVAAPFEDMPNYTTTGALAVGFGNMAEAYQIVERHGVRTLRDPFSAKPYIEFYSIKRVGGALTNGNAMKLIAFQS